MPDDLVSAIEKLPDRFASALRLWIAGATPAEVGRRLGLDEASVEAFLAIAEEKLRSLILADGDAATENGHRTASNFGAVDGP